MYEEAAKFLALQGRHNIGLLQWALPWQNANDEAKEKPFIDILGKHGVEVREKWIVDQPYPDQQGGWHAFQTLWNAYPEKPDAVFIADDILFPTAASAIVEAGVKVPAQLSVLTHANRGSGILYPFPLVAIAYDRDECADMMADMMVKLVQNEKVVQPHVQLPFRIVNVEKVPASA
jgi:DNA-binding LacI/PurR family transcriptional regulator